MLKLNKSVFRRYELKQLILGTIIAVTILVSFIWHLGTLTPGYSPAEKAAITESSNTENILSNPVYAPHKIFQNFFTRVDDSATLTRVVSVILGIVVVFCFYYVCKKWFGKTIAVFASLIFITSPWLILNSRSADTSIALLLSITFIAAYIWLSSADKKTIPLLLTAAVAVSLIYIPGMIWFLLLASFFWRKKIIQSISSVSILVRSGALLILLIGATPLILAAIDDISVLKKLLLIPQDFPSVMDIFTNIFWGISSLVWSTRFSYSLIIDRLPLLNITVIALSVFGSYVMWIRAKTELLVLGSLILIALVGYGLNADLTLLGIALPAIAFLVAAGLRFLYAEWRSVFPVNPLPKSLAMVLIVALVGLNMVYGIRYCLAAWPNYEATKSTFVLK